MDCNSWWLSGEVMLYKESSWNSPLRHNAHQPSYKVLTKVLILLVWLKWSWAEQELEAGCLYALLWYCKFLFFHVTKTVEEVR